MASLAVPVEVGVEVGDRHPIYIPQISVHDVRQEG